MEKTALILVIIGAINWLLVGVLGFDAVAFLFGGADSVFARIVYTLVGIAGLVSIATLVRLFREDDAEDLAHAQTQT